MNYEANSRVPCAVTWGELFIYSFSAQLIYFKVDSLNSKRIINTIPVHKGI